MNLLPPTAAEKIPPIGSDPETPLEESWVHLKYFDPSSSWRWYVLEWDGEDTFFGLVVTRHTATAGQFTLTELRAICYEGQDAPGTGVQRDLTFEPCKVARLVQEAPSIKDVFQRKGPREARSGGGLVQLKDYDLG